MTPKKKKIPEKLVFSIYLAITIILLIGAVLFSIGHDKGYRIKGLTLKKTSTVEMTVSEPGAWVFIGERPIHKTDGHDAQISITDVEPGLQLVTVIKDSYFPWAKRLDIPSDSKLTLYPFLLKQDLEAEPVLFGYDSFSKVSKYFNNPINTPQTSYETKEHRISIIESSISIECLEECSVPPINLETPPTSIHQFLNNPNVVIYTTSREIWVSELVADLRISYKIFEGNDLEMFPEKDGLFIKSSGNFYRIDL